MAQFSVGVNSQRAKDEKRRADHYQDVAELFTPEEIEAARARRAELVRQEAERARNLELLAERQRRKPSREVQARAQQDGRSPLGRPSDSQRNHAHQPDESGHGGH